jgi:hypothetical protein
MFKRAFITLTVLVFMSFAAIAQNSDQVTLKNGTIIRGTVVKMIPNGNVTINDRAGNTWVFAMNEVELIEEVEEDEIFSNVFTPGFVNMTTIGFLAGSQSSQYIAPFSMQTSVGYMTSMGIYTGALVGLEFLNVNHIPVMFDFQYALKSGPVMPVLIARAGYALPTKSSSDYYGTEYNYSGGIAGSIGMGLKLRKNEGIAWDISLQYRYMQIAYSEKYEWQDFQNEYKDVYNRLELRLGFYLGR